MDKFDFGTPHNPNIKQLSSRLVECLSDCGRNIGAGIRFEPKTLQLTPEKAYTARAEIPVSYDREVGTLYAILFCPGDGTGDAKTYSLSDVIIPKDLQFKEKPERVVPRKKTCAFEVFFPFFTALGSTIEKYYSNLDVLSFAGDRKTISRVGNLRSIGRAKAGQPYASLTTGHRVDGTRFGDPHAIYCDKYSEAMQVVGFLSVDKADSPLARLLRTLPHEQ